MAGEEAEKTKPSRGSSDGASSDDLRGEVIKIWEDCEGVFVEVGVGGGLVVGAAWAVLKGFETSDFVLIIVASILTSLSSSFTNPVSSIFCRFSTLRELAEILERI